MAHMDKMKILSVRCFRWTSVRGYRSEGGEIPRLTMPHKMVEKLQRIKSKDLAAAHQLKRAYKGPLVISCSKKRYNHYKGQSYSDFSPQHLASGGWKNTKSVGDYFTINAYGSNPALGDPQSGVEFGDFGLRPKLLEGLAEHNVNQPTNIQALTIPVMMEGKNVLCAAETGSGKTLAFLLPILHRIQQYKQVPHAYRTTNSPYAVILTPARELADQIHSVAEDLRPYVDCIPQVICGGRGTKKILINRPESEMDLLVTTPGVFSKLLTMKIILLSRLSHIVLDEADTLLDDSFNDLTVRLLQRLKVTSEQATSLHSNHPQVTGTQVVFAGATVPTSLEEILKDVVPFDTVEKVTTSHLHRLMPHVAQKFVRLSPIKKTEEFLKLMKANVAKHVPTLVFCNRSPTANYLGYFLEDNGINNVVFHANMPQKVRDGRFEDFQNGATNVLISTDVASRGLDTIRAQHVVNYDFPGFMSDYIHRVGRVGRVGSFGSSFVVSYVCHKWEMELLWKIEAGARRMTELHNVNANIKRKLNAVIETKYNTEPQELDELHLHA